MKRGALTNVRDVASSFVGREDDKAALALSLDEGRLVTILGPGGMGKTRLALRFAHERVAAFSAHRGGGVWFCDLSEARDEQDVISAVAAALDVKLESGAASETVGHTIARRGRVLVVLDNFDRLASAAASTVGTWLRQAPSARFLVTSRVPLEVIGEQIWSLSPLSRDQAIELFVRRARQVRPSFDPHGELALVGEVVDMVDRMPLAIELAATRMTILTVAQLRERLSRPLEILSGMERTVLDSLELLPPSTRRLFSACSVMHNGFSLEAAEAIFGDVVVPDGEVMEELETLVRNSLLRVVIEPNDEHARYSFFETIRDVAERQCARDDARERVLSRHAAYYASLCERSRREEEDASSLAHDLENILGAQETARADATVRGATQLVAIALGLEPLLLARGSTPLAARLAADALGALRTEDDAVRAELMLARGFAQRELGKTALAREDFDQGLAFARSANRSDLAAVALTRIGEMTDLAGDTREAHARFDEALALLSATPRGRAREAREAEAYLRLGHALRREGDLAKARAASTDAVTRYRSLGRDDGLASSIYELAVIEMFAGSTDSALAHFDEGLEVAHRGGVRVLQGALKTARGCVLQDLGRQREALEHHAEAARIFHEVGSRYREASALYYLATTYFELGLATEAESILRRASERLSGVGAARYEALMAGCLACALAASDRFDAALVEMGRAETAAALVRNEGALVCTLRIHRLALELRAQGWKDASAVIAHAESLVARDPTDDSRFALRALGQVVRGEQRDHDALVVWEEGSAFQMPGESKVTLPERSPLRRILQHFATRRIEAPGEIVSIDEVIAVGWPSERIGAEAGLNRAHVALASLRKLGLRDALLYGSGGYAISRAIVVRLEIKSH